MKYQILGREYPKHYDAIVIGSGIGGLFCANLLADAGMKVLVIEQHYVLGGYCSSFRRKGFLFDSATHFYPLLGNPTTLTGKLLTSGLLLRNGVDYRLGEDQYRIDFQPWKILVFSQ